MNDYYARLIAPGEKIAVAVSGGSDSVALLHFLLEKSKEIDFTVSAVNIEHGIRGDSSKRDSAFVKELCSAWGVELFSFSANAPARAEKERISLEQAARAERYDAFYSLLAQGKADKIATAHHAGDNTETVLFNLFRGASVKGVSGIPPQKGGVIRPFLHTTKAEIEEYIEKNALTFVEDETNADPTITRNFIRLKILPEVKRIFPEGDIAVARFCEIAREEDGYLDALAEKYITEKDGVIAVSVSAPRVLLRRAAVSALKRAGLKADYEAVHADGILRLVAAENGTEFTLPSNLIAKREYERITVFAKEKKHFGERPFSVGTFFFGGGKLTVKESTAAEAAARLGKTEGEFYADAEKFGEDVTVRTRREGDVFCKFGGKTKKLKSYYIDEKIPARLRDEFLLIARGTEILFAGTEISDRVRVEERTERVLKITYETQRRF